MHCSFQISESALYSTIDPTMLQFPGATGRVKLVHEVEIEGQQIAALLVVLPHSVAVVDVSNKV